MQEEEGEEEEEEMGDSGDAILAHLQTGDTTREDQSHLETGEGGDPSPLATGGGHLETDVGPGIIVPVPREIGEVLPPIDVRDGGGGTVPLIILLMSEAVHHTTVTAICLLYVRGPRRTRGGLRRIGGPRKEGRGPRRRGKVPPVIDTRKIRNTKVVRRNTREETVAAHPMRTD